MEGSRNKTMRGALLFAYNTEKYNYYTMAVYAAKRINHFLGLPVTVITDENSISDDPYKFDHTIITIPDKNNKRDWGTWINKGRYQAYELSPYDETLLLDTDYVVNSDKLLQTFNMSTDFCCHAKTEFFMQPGLPQEFLSPFSFETLWATVIMFKKTKKSQQLFDCIKMIQNNFEHYANIHGFISSTFRNDYALTIATRMVNGHILQHENIIPWSLYHVSKNTKILSNNTNHDSTEFSILYENNIRGKTRMEYINIKDMDFHMMSKDNYMELIQ